MEKSGKFVRLKKWELCMCLEINECASNPCAANANCTDKVNGHDCACNEGYTGDGTKECTRMQCIFSVVDSENHIPAPVKTCWKRVAAARDCLYNRAIASHLSNNSESTTEPFIINV